MLIKVGVPPYMASGVQVVLEVHVIREVQVIVALWVQVGHHYHH